MSNLPSFLPSDVQSVISCHTCRHPPRQAVFRLLSVAWACTPAEAGAFNSSWTREGGAWVFPSSVPHRGSWLSFTWRFSADMCVLLSSPFCAFKLQWELFSAFPWNYPKWTPFIWCNTQQRSLWEGPQGAAFTAWTVPLCEQPRRTCIPEKKAVKPSISYSVNKLKENGTEKISGEPGAGGWPYWTPFWEAVCSLPVSAFFKEARFCTLCVNNWSCVKDTNFSSFLPLL